MIINESLVQKTCHNSLIEFYHLSSIIISLSISNYLLFLSYTSERQFDIPCTMTLLYIALDAGFDQWRGEVRDCNNRVIPNFLIFMHDNCSAYGEFILALHSLLLANVVIFIQTVNSLVMLSCSFKLLLKVIFS